MNLLMMKTPLAFRLVLILLLAGLLFSHSTAAREIVQEGSTETLQPLVTFRFEGGEKRIIDGRATEKADASTCRGHFPSDDVIGNFTAVSIFFQNGCYTDGTFNYKSFPFTIGRLRGTDGSTYEAVRVEEPADKTVKFLGSHHALFYKAQGDDDYEVYTYDRGSLRKIASMGKENVRTGQFGKIPGADLSLIGTPTIFVIVPGKSGLNAYHKLNDRTEGAFIRKTPWGRFEKFRISTGGRPFDTESDFTDGPVEHGNIYGIHRQSFFLPGPGDRATILYQDKSEGKIIAIHLDAGLRAVSEVILSVSKNDVLAAAANDAVGNIYVMRIGTGKGDARPVRLQKFSPEGRLLVEKLHDSSKQALNLYAYSDGIVKAPAVTSMAYADGTLGVILSRTMHKSGDGLNHQGAIAVTFDAATLALVKNHGQTSGHSFGNFLFAEGKGFVGIDLGDNYPRGVHLHRFDRDKRNARVVFTFKTQHGNSPANAAGRVFPEYPEISTPAKRFYQWSNDNRTYTEIGGIAPTDKGYLILFATELPSLANARASEALNDPRNLAVIHVRRDFETVKQNGNFVLDEIMVWKAQATEGQFYDFGGKLNAQRNSGVMQLTSYKSNTQNVSRPRLIRVGANRNLVLYEEWSARSYLSTHALEFDDNGKVTRSIELGPIWRLNRQDDIYVHRGRLISLSGAAADKKMELQTIVLE